VAALVSAAPERVQIDYNQEAIPPARRGLPVRQQVTAALRVPVPANGEATLTSTVQVES